MGFLNRVRNVFRSDSELLYLDELRKDSAAEQLLAQAALFESRPAKTADYLDLYTKLSSVYACVFAIASAMAQIRLRFYDLSGVKTKEILPKTQHHLLSLFNRPSPYMTYYDLIETTVSFTELAGNGYWELVKVGDIVTEIYPLRPDYMEAKPSPKERISNWEFNVQGRKIYFKPDEISHFKYFHPSSDLYGLAPTAPALDPAVLDLYTIKYNKIYFKQGARIGGVIERDRGLGAQPKIKLESDIEQHFSGWDKAFRLPILPPGHHYKPVVANHKEMEFRKQRQMSKVEICQAYGVPPAIIGDFEGTSYASAYEQRKMFYLETVIPKALKYCSQINISVVGPSYPNVVAIFDKTSIEALKEEEETKARYVSILADRGIMTINEIRKDYYSLPPVPWGEQPFMRKSMRPVSLLSEIDLMQEAKKGHNSWNKENTGQNNGHFPGILNEFLEELIDSYS